MATFATMTTSVRSALRDSEAAFITDAQIGVWLNEAYLDICSRASLLQTNVGGVTSATSTITLPSDFIRFVSLGLDATSTTGIPVIEPVLVSNAVFLSYVNQESDPPTYIMRIYEDVIDIYPLLIDRDYTMEYIKKPAVLTGSDVPAIPEELHIKLINYARAHAKMVEGELQESAAYMELYERGLIAQGTATERRFPGPVSITIEPGYFD